MTAKNVRLSLVAILLTGLLVPAGCSKKKADEPAAASEAAAPRSDPRLEPDPGAAAGAPDPGAAASGAGEPAGDPHAGGAMAGSPHGGMAPGAASPHGAMPTGGGGGGGRTPEKTADGRVVLGPVAGAVPESWKVRPTTSGMRVAEWTIPGKAGEAELVVYYFGAGGAGTAEANLERWVNQFEQPAGAPSSDKARIDKKTVAGMPVTQVEVSGHYVAAVMPGAAEKQDKPDHTLLGAIVETSQGPYYFKFVGPRATAAAAKKEFQAFIDSLKPAS
jgi:hypothetical protein